VQDKKSLKFLLKDSLNLYINNFWKFISVAAIYYVPVFLINTYILINFNFRQIRILEDIEQFGVMALFGFSAILGLFIFYIAFIQSIQIIENNAEFSVLSVYQHAFSLFGSYCWIAGIVIIKVFLWSLLLIIPGIIFSFFYTFAPLILILEKKTGTAALIQSKKVVKANFGKFLGNLFAALVIVLIIVLMCKFIINIWFGTYVIGSRALIPLIGYTISEMIEYAMCLYVLIFQYYLYKDLRVRVQVKES